MAKLQKKTFRYSISFKQKVVREIEEEGLSLAAASGRYGIKGSHTVRRWVEKLGRNHLLNKVVRIEMKGEKDRIKELEAEVARLKVALADSVLVNDLLNSLIKVAGEHYGTDLKKNFGPGPSPGSLKRGKSTQ